MLRSQILRKSAREDDKFVRPRHRTPLPPENIPGAHFRYSLNRPQVHSGAGRNMSMKNFNHKIGSRTHNFSACSAVPQATAPPLAPYRSV